jgi:hypothetical protein
MTRTGFTALSDFGRTLRDEPAFGVYAHRIWVAKNDVLSAEVHAWLKKRYAETRKGYLYRVVTYLHTDGNRYVDFIWMQTCTDKDLIEIKLRWGFSEHKVSRGERVPRRKLTKEQRTKRDEIVNRALTEFYDSLETA